VIRFSAFLVVVAVGLLLAGVVTSELVLVYVAIGVSGVALLALAVGALVKRKELFGPSTSAEPQLARPEPAAVHVSPGQPAPQAVPWGATVPAASAWPAAAAQPAPSRAGYLPAEQPLPPQPVKAQPADVAATAWRSGIPAQTERPAERPADVPRRPAAFTPRPPAGPPSPAQGVPAPGLSAWEWHPDAPATQEMPRIGAAPASASSAPAAPPAPPPVPPPPAAAPAPSATAPASVGPPASAAPPPPAAPPEWPAPAAAFVPKVASPPPEPVSADPPSAEPSSAEPSSAEPSPASESRPPSQDQPSQDQLPPAEDQREAEDQPQDSPAAEETQQLPVAASTATDAAPVSSEGREPAAEAAVTPETPEAPEASDTPEAPDTPDTPEAPDSVDLQREVTVVPGVPRYHHPHCLLIRFMGEDDLDKMTLGAARQAGCTPCRACLPDQAEADPELDPPEPERQAEIALDVLPRRVGLRTRRLSRSRARKNGSRISTRPGLDREHLDRQDLAGDQPSMLGQGRDHLRVL